MNLLFRRLSPSLFYHLTLSPTPFIFGLSISSKWYATNSSLRCFTRPYTERIRIAFHHPLDMAFLDVAVFILSSLASAGLLAFVAAGFSLAVQPTWIVRWVQRKVPDVVFLKSTHDLVAALTIDDGPHKGITEELLDILKENDCRATWFIIGSNMDACPGLVERIHAEGHEVGNHTMYDTASWQLPQEEFKKQLLEVDCQLNKYYFKDRDGRQVKWFRPGHGFYNKQILETAEAYQYRTALGSLFPLDTLFSNQGRLIAKYLLWRIHPGAVIILHDRVPQKKQTAEVLRVLLPELKRKGYSIVSLFELLSLQRNSSETGSKSD